MPLVPRRSSRPARCRRRWSALLGLCITFASAATALVLLAWAVGRASPHRPSGWGESLLVSASSPGAALVLAFAGGTLAAWSLRRLMLHWLAWLPGRIEVATFVAGSELTGACPEQLTVRFRRQLGTLRLQAPTPLPGAPPERDFVDVLSRSGADSRNMLGAILGLLRAARPTHAYEVRGALLERDERPRFGVAIEVARMPSQSLLSTTLWASTWDDVITEAADEATAAILPLTRQCRAPWTSWRGRRMPYGLLHAFEQGARTEQARRYDEALHFYRRAVQADPLNMTLRLRVGQLQERMGLYLDSLLTYMGMQSTDERPWWVRRCDSGRGERRVAVQAARYRRNVLLGGRVLALHWQSRPSDPSSPSLRDRRREQLRACLRPALIREIGEPALTPMARRALKEPRRDDRRAFLELRRLLGRFALEDCARLRRRLRWPPFQRGHLTPASVRLTEECIRVRLAWIDHALARQTGRNPGEYAWPPSPPALAHRIRTIERGSLRVPCPIAAKRSFRLWHEHYNAACVYALALQDHCFKGKEVREELARLAISRLCRAMTRADSAFIAGRRDWLLSEDPDLIGLRARLEFTQFEMLFLPGTRETGVRPLCAHQVESGQYVRSLLAATAEQWHLTWHARSGDVRRGADIHTLLAWFRDELHGWQSIATVVHNHRHPESRLALISETAASGERYGFPPLDVRFPRYAGDASASTDPETCERAGRQVVAAWDNRLVRIGALLGTSGSRDADDMLDDLRRWYDALRAMDARSVAPPVALLVQLTRRHAGLWQLLGQWVNADTGSAAGMERQFRDLAASTRILWCADPTGRFTAIVSRELRAA